MTLDLTYRTMTLTRQPRYGVIKLSRLRNHRQQREDQFTIMKTEGSRISWNFNTQYLSTIKDYQPKVIRYQSNLQLNRSDTLNILISKRLLWILFRHLNTSNMCFSVNFWSNGKLATFKYYVYDYASILQTPPNSLDKVSITLTQH